MPTGPFLAFAELAAEPVPQVLQRAEMKPSRVSAQRLRRLMRATVQRRAEVVEVYVDEGGQQIMRLTPKGEKVARQLATTGEDGQDALMRALLGDEG